MEGRGRGWGDDGGRQGVRILGIECEVAAPGIFLRGEILELSQDRRRGVFLLLRLHMISGLHRSFPISHFPAREFALSWKPERSRLTIL